MSSQAPNERLARTRKEIKHLIDQLKLFLNNESVYAEEGNIIVAREGICFFAQGIGDSPVECYRYKFDFGQYLDPDYKSKSYANRPLAHINEFRKKNKVRELEYVNKEIILMKEK